VVERKSALHNGLLELLKEIRGCIGGGLLCQDPQHLTRCDFLSPVSNDSDSFFQFALDLLLPYFASAKRVSRG
jgi:hypothetical protein